jgi:hypothetical protein
MSYKNRKELVWKMYSRKKEKGANKENKVKRSTKFPRVRTHNTRILCMNHSWNEVHILKQMKCDAA